MRRRDLFTLGLCSAAIAKLFHIRWPHSVSDVLTEKNGEPTHSLLASTEAFDAQVSVDWSTAVAETTPFTFGSNDYEITDPKKAADRVYQSLLDKIGIELIRIHHADLSDRWTKAETETWNESKIKAGFDVSYPQPRAIVQNISSWPEWMSVNDRGLLDPSEYDNYAAFCAELVEIVNRKQQRNVRFWEPFNEKDKDYDEAGQLDELWKIYNKAATAMKAIDPQIKVGGPALTWDDSSKLRSFLQACGPNVDFISWHRYVTGDADAPTDELMSYTAKYGEQVQKFRELATEYIPDRTVPLFLGEYNINYSWDSGENRQNTHIGAVWFASVLKHLADAGIEMAASWHLKDGIYGMIDPKNNLRPAATVFSWGIEYLTGTVMNTESDDSSVEAMAVSQSDRDRSLLLINKSSDPVRLALQMTPDESPFEGVSMFSLDADGVEERVLTDSTFNVEPLNLNPYSLVLLRFSRDRAA